MRDLNSIPYKVLISMENQSERRNDAQRQFKDMNLDVIWKIPVKLTNINWNILPGIYRQHPKYASQTLTLIEVFRSAKQNNVESMMLFEDDIIFHPEFKSLLPQIEFPNDWKFIYIGGRNCGVKEHVSKGLVKSSFVSDLHAVIIRGDMFDVLERVLLDRTISSHWADARIGSLHKTYPAYLCRPNLAWQSVHTNDSGKGDAYSNYNEDGSVKQGEGN
jgi:hypothetical protein